MGKQLKTLKDFFEGRRREARLNKSELLSTRAEEKRMKLHLSMPLSNIAATGMPSDFVEPFGLMEKETSVLNQTKVEVIFKGMTCDIFDLAKTKPKDRALTQSGTTMQGFRLVAEGEAEKRAVSLEFVVYLPYSEALYQACSTHHHKTLFLEAVYSQSEMDFDGEAVEQYEEDETEEEEVVQ